MRDVVGVDTRIPMPQCRPDPSNKKQKMCMFVVQKSRFSSRQVFVRNNASKSLHQIYTMKLCPRTCSRRFWTFGHTNPKKQIKTNKLPSAVLGKQIQQTNAPTHAQIADHPLSYTKHFFVWPIADQLIVLLFVLSCASRIHGTGVAIVRWQDVIEMIRQMYACVWFWKGCDTYRKAPILPKPPRFFLKWGPLVRWNLLQLHGALFWTNKSRRNSGPVLFGILQHDRVSMLSYMPYCSLAVGRTMCSRFFSGYGAGLFWWKLAKLKSSKGFSCS